MKKDKHDWKVETANLFQPSVENLEELDYRSWRERTVVMIHGMYVSSKWNWSVLKRMVTAYISKV